VHQQVLSLLFHLKRKLKLLLEKKIITDEHSGRILVDSVLAEEEKKMEQLFSKYNTFKVPITSGLFDQPDILYSFTKSVGTYINLLSYLANKATLAYNLFSKPRDGSYRLTVAKHYCNKPKRKHSLFQRSNANLRAGNSHVILLNTRLE
jgi:hypothetical protein